MTDSDSSTDPEDFEYIPEGRCTLKCAPAPCLAPWAEGLILISAHRTFTSVSLGQVKCAIRTVRPVWVGRRRRKGVWPGPAVAAETRRRDQGRASHHLPTPGQMVLQLQNIELYINVTIITRGIDSTMCVSLTSYGLCVGRQATPVIPHCQ